jgi:membrane fusion protein (multidrug efflux system)
MQKMDWRYFCLAVSLLSIVPAACDNRPPAREAVPEIRAAVVEVRVLHKQPWVEAISSFGVIDAAKEIAITTDFSERVKKVHVKEGARIEAGQLLIELDRRKQELRLARYRTALREARATLTNSQTTLKRQEALFAGRNIAQSKLEEAQLALKTASARYEEALAAVQLAERELADRKITSPAAGQVEKRTVEPGETVSPGAPLMVIQVVDAVRVITYVTQKDINHLSPGSKATVTTPAVPGRTYTARIESLGTKADPDTGNFSVKLAISNTEGLLRPGMTARVNLQGRKYQEAILIPDSALVDRNRRRVAYKVVDGKALQVEPVFALSTIDQVHVLSGLQAGDQLIVEGVENIVDGTPVKVVAIEAGSDNGS